MSAPQYQMHNVQLNKIGYSAQTPFQIKEQITHLRLVPRSTNLVEDFVLSYEEKANTALMISYILLDEQVSLVQQAPRNSIPLTVLIEVGGFTASLLAIGHLLTRFSLAKTFFLVSFTEDMFQQSSSDASKFDSKAAGDASVKPLRENNETQNLKLALFEKVQKLCSTKRPEMRIVLAKEDTDLMWNNFLRFRQKIKYNLMSVVFCCSCTRACRSKADSELYKQLLLKSSEEKLHKSLDVRSILRTNKYLKLLMNSTLSKRGRFLIRN